MGTSIALNTYGEAFAEVIQSQSRYRDALKIFAEKPNYHTARELQKAQKLLDEAARAVRGKYVKLASSQAETIAENVVKANFR